MFIYLPESFDARTKWKLLPIRNQQQCGSCWAFSATEVLADRYSVQYDQQIVLSPQELISCDKKDMGCNGGYLQNAWEFLNQTGVVSDNCYPYTSGSGKKGYCLKQCTNNNSYNIYKSTEYNTFSDVNSIKTEIYLNGPIQTGFLVYSDFLSYKGGIYVHQGGQLEGGHAVKIVGWGNDPTSGEYWIVANSWGTMWGEEGYFRIAMNQHQLQFEQQGIAGKAIQIQAPQMTSYEKNIYDF